jgi:thermostable 8-oxoguanine DNA glycosylase
MDEEVEEHLKIMKKDFETRFATYIANTMLQFQDREAILAGTTLSKCDFA